ncbi:MAG: hypothetical protein M0C28_03135 [Candidatus Moduliflexus flocculans]|nr:hypothetical protein [Candidatus Moduliflexus flocculans]
MDIQEVNIKQGGISAEFGRAAGMVTNAITKSGSNTITGSVRFVFEPSSFQAAPKDWHASTIVTPYDQSAPAIGVGGPLIKDRLFWYVSGNLPYSRTSGRVGNLGAVPNARTTSREFFGKITANPFKAHLFSLSVRNNDYTSKNSGIGVNDALIVATSTEKGPTGSSSAPGSGRSASRPSSRPVTTTSRRTTAACPSPTSATGRPSTWTTSRPWATSGPRPATSTPRRPSAASTSAARPEFNTSEFLPRRDQARPRANTSISRANPTSSSSVSPTTTAASGSGARPTAGARSRPRPTTASPPSGAGITPISRPRTPAAGPTRSSSRTTSPSPTA